jgi:ankyrin repeat protein
MSFTRSVNVDKYILSSLLNINEAIMFINTCKYSKNIINNCKKIKHDNNLNEILIEMCDNNKYKCVELLIKTNVNINVKTIKNWTALHFTCFNGYHKCMELLIKANANINDKDIDGWTALHYACYWGFDKCAELLIKANANINEKDNFGWTASYYAHKNGRNKCTKLLESVNL